MSRVFATGLGDQNMVIEDVTIETETSREKQPKATEVLVFSVRPKASQAGRCRRRCPGYDAGGRDGDAMRRWRTLDVGTTKASLQARSHDERGSSTATPAASTATTRRPKPRGEACYHLNSADSMWG